MLHLLRARLRQYDPHWPLLFQLHGRKTALGDGAEATMCVLVVKIKELQDDGNGSGSSSLVGVMVLELGMGFWRVGWSGEGGCVFMG